jgi:hypothetical protein
MTLRGTSSRLRLKCHCRPFLPARTVIRVTDSSLTGITYAPAIPEPDPLPALCAEFPEFRIWREITCDRLLYYSRSRHWRTNPHTVITDDIDELAATLRKARAPQSRPGGPQ